MDVRAAAVGRAARLGAEARRLDAELAGHRRRLREMLFPEQLAVVDDPHPWKSILTPGQAGKSTCLAAMLVDKALTVPARAQYIALNRIHARDIMWPTLTRLTSELGLRVSPNLTDLHVHFPGGGYIAIGGCQDEKDVEPYRGTPKSICAIDECKSFSDHLLRRLIYDAIQPRLNTYRGPLVLSGSPGEIFAGLFYEVTGPSSNVVSTVESEPYVPGRPYEERDHPRWRGVTYKYSQHWWPLEANVKAPHLWKLALETKRTMGWPDDNPTWIREYEGRWAEDNTTRVYRFLAETDTWVPGRALGENPYGLLEPVRWRYILGCDSGYGDPFAFVLWAYSLQCPVAYEVWEHQLHAPTLSEIAETIKARMQVTPIDIIVGDFPSSGKGNSYIAELTVTHQLVVKLSDKREKLNHVQVMNSDLREGWCKVLRGGRLAQQWGYLTWNDSRQREREGQPNDFADAALYGYRECRHHVWSRAPSEPRSELERMAAEAKRQRDRAHQVQAEEAPEITVSIEDSEGANETYGWGEWTR